VVERWGETPIWQFFSGMDCYVSCPLFFVFQGSMVIIET
jgi:hypothetical protein